MSVRRADCARTEAPAALLRATHLPFPERLNARIVRLKLLLEKRREVRCKMKDDDANRKLERTALA